MPKTAVFPGISVSSDIGGFSLAWQARALVLSEFIVISVVVGLSGLTLWAGTALFAAIAVGLVTANLGRPRLALSALDDLPKLATRTMVAAAAIAVPVAVFGSLSVAVSILLTGAIAIIPLFIARICSYAALRKIRRSTPQARDATVIVGSGTVANYIAERLAQRTEFGLRPIGYADNDTAATRADIEPSTLPRISTLADFPETLNETRVTTIVFAYSLERESDLLPYVRSTVAAGYKTYVVPRFFEATDRASATDSVWGLPLAYVGSPNQGAQRIMKRSLDVFVAGTALLLVAPLMALIALVLPRETGAGIMFRQKRIGEGGEPFELLKFQTMCPATAKEGDTNWNIAEDDRLKSFGRFLRRTSLDELPQFWNVLRGDMSLVGPRPERPHFVEQFSAELPHYSTRHRVPVGLTGWAQIHQLRGDTSIDDRARFDNVYCDSWSLWEDIKIMCRTLPEVLRSAGR